MIQPRVCEYCGSDVGAFDDDMWETLRKIKCDQCKAVRAKDGRGQG